MSLFTIFNSYDGTTVGADSGAIVTLHVGVGALITVKQGSDILNSEVTVIRTVLNGNLTQQGAGFDPGSDGDHSKLVQPLAVLPPLAGDSNVMHAGVTFLNGSAGMSQLGFILIFHPTTSGVGVDVALPADVIDIQTDLLLRAVVSRILSQIQGIKVGDNVKFGVVPSRSGTFVGTGVDSIKLSIRPVGKFLRDPLEFDNEASPTVAGSGDNQYYALDFALDDDALAAWFSDANAAQEGGDTTTDVNQLQVAAELRFDEGGVITTTDTFFFTLFQSIVSPAP